MSLHPATILPMPSGPTKKRSEGNKHGTRWMVLAAIGVGVFQLRPDWNERLMLLLNATALSWPLVWACITVLGTAGFSLLAAGVLGPRAAVELARLALVLLAGAALVQTLKHFLGYPRPSESALGTDLVYLGQMLTSKSMPSGHAACAAATAWLLAGCLRRGLDASCTRLMLQGVLLAIAVLVCLSRVAVGAHWPADVMAGALLGLLTASAAERWSPLQRLSQQVALAMTTAPGLKMTASVMALTTSFWWVNTQEMPIATPSFALVAAMGVVAAARWWFAVEPAQTPKTTATKPFQA